MMTHPDFESIVTLINEARNRAYSKVNEELVLLYFNVGRIVSEKVSSGFWGDGTVDELANFIVAKMPGIGGFNRRGLYRMKQFFDIYSDPDFVSPVAAQLEKYLSSIDKKSIVSALPTQLNVLSLQHRAFVSSILTKVSWTNHLEIISQTKSTEEKFFYLICCINEKWSMRELRRQLSSSFFERSMISKQQASTLSKKLPSELFRDPYIFEFLELPIAHTETDLEKALVNNLQKFILEIGKGFTYMGNQYRLQVGNKDYHTDLLFYHRDLQCLVMFELKIQEFMPEFIGKLNFYLEALDRIIKRPHENPSIGVLLCKGKNTEVVEYAMARNISPALVVDYETKLIDKKILSNKLHQLVEQLSKDELETAIINA
jgi:predicted nuclease of restriction endonuclease-like (RecB) superfamily